MFAVDGKGTVSRETSHMTVLLLWGTAEATVRTAAMAKSEVASILEEVDVEDF